MRSSIAPSHCCRTTSRNALASSGRAQTTQTSNDLGCCSMALLSSLQFVSLNEGFLTQFNDNTLRHLQAAKPLNRTHLIDSPDAANLPVVSSSHAWLVSLSAPLGTRST